ncbi:MAG: hypothetical protein ACODAU_10420 [Myxococcota bacterium]
MTQPDLQQVKQTLLDAGIEVYRTTGDEIHVAERVRLHIMDSGVRVQVGGGLAVQFTARSQRSDSPSAGADELFDLVRKAVGSDAKDRGYGEAGADTVHVTDPVDASKVLDVWHEVTYRKPVSTVDDVVEEVRWALGVDKYVTP